MVRYIGTKSILEPLPTNYSHKKVLGRPISPLNAQALGHYGKRKAIGRRFLPPSKPFVMGCRATFLLKILLGSRTLKDVKRRFLMEKRNRKRNRTVEYGRAFFFCSDIDH